MKQIGKTIQIFLPDGNPKGLKIAEITSRTVMAVLIPRSKLEEAAKRDELSGVGVYMLFGVDKSKPKIYIGEAESCLIRLKQHNKSKEFWTQAIAFVSKTQHFTKTHIKYLEWLCCDVAAKAKRFELDNGNMPTKPHVQESVEADLYDNFDSIQLLVSTLGFPVFDEIKKPEKSELILCKGKDAYAEGEYTEEGLTIFAGAKCNLIETASAGNWVRGMRSELLERGLLKEDGQVLILTQDYIASSPSAAAAIVLARQANGWIEWKYEDGKTLDDVKRQAV